MSIAPVSGADAPNFVKRAVNLDVSWKQNIDGLTLLSTTCNDSMMCEPPSEFDRKGQTENLDLRSSFDSSRSLTLVGSIWNDHKGGTDNLGKRLSFDSSHGMTWPYSIWNNHVVHEPSAEFDGEGRANQLDKRLSFESSHDLTLPSPTSNDAMVSDLLVESDREGKSKKLVKRLPFDSSQQGKRAVDIDRGHGRFLNSALTVSTLLSSKVRGILPHG